MERAFFGRPGDDMQEGGTHVAVYVVPVWQGQLVLFEVVEGPKAIRGRWLPWEVLGFRENPYECAALIADSWLAVDLLDMRLVDVMSNDLPAEGWEIAVIFRADMSAMPPGDSARRPVLVAPGHFDAIASFDPVDLERWVGGGDSGTRPTGLVF